MLRPLFWGSLAALAWTHVGYPAAAAALARVRARPVRKAELTPTVSVVVAAWNEEEVIERRLENLLALEYPPEQLEILVAGGASDARPHQHGEDRAAPPPPPRHGPPAPRPPGAAQNHPRRLRADEHTTEHNTK